MDCNKCIYKDVCAGFGITQLECNYFKEEERFVELHCKPGDNVYQIESRQVVKRKVVSITIEEWGLSYEFWIDGFGFYRTSQNEKVFFSEEEAQAVLNKFNHQNKHFMDRFTEVK